MQVGRAGEVRKSTGCSSIRAEFQRELNMIFADDATTGECTEAAKADRRRAYRCPIAPCKYPVTLVRPTTKARRAHFAHKESRPLCPLYESPVQTVEHWNWADSARVRRLGVLNRTQPVVPLCTDVTPRIALPPVPMLSETASSW